MKKAMAILLVLMLLPVAALGESMEMTELEQLRRQVSFTWTRYENRVYGFAFSIPDSFAAMEETKLKEWLDNVQQEEEGDDIYDIRYWDANDGTLSFETQVKEPTYESFEVELSKAPDYLSFIQEDYDAAGYQNLRMLHEGVVRKTPLGDMLEMAIQYEIPTGMGAVTVQQVYYDLYMGELEYIFAVTGYNLDYDTLQSLLDTIVWTAGLTV